MKMPGITIKPVPPPEPGEPEGPLWKKLAWFAALALAGVLVVGGVAYVLRALPFYG